MSRISFPLSQVHVKSESASSVLTLTNQDLQFSHSDTFSVNIFRAAGVHIVAQSDLDVAAICREHPSSQS